MKLPPVKLSQFYIVLHQQSQRLKARLVKNYQELGLEYLHDRRWMRRLCLFYKVFFNKVPKYIYELIPPFRHSFRNPNSFTSFTCRTVYFKNSFFPSLIILLSYLSFKNALINFIRFSENKIFNIHDEVGIKLLTKLRLGFSHLREHKVRYNFADTLNSLLQCNN